MASARSLRKQLAAVQLQARAPAPSPVHALFRAAEIDLLLYQLDTIRPPSRKRARSEDDDSEDDDELEALVSAAYVTAGVSSSSAHSLPAKRARLLSSADHTDLLDTPPVPPLRLSASAPQ